MAIEDLVGKALSTTETIIKSGKEEQKSRRHETDMASDSFLSKNVRPGTLLFLMLCQTLIIVAELADRSVSDAIIIQVGTLLTGAFSFYFYSRRTEKIAVNNAKANIRIEKIKAKTARRNERIDRRKKTP